uniref:Uncharacterized protein n=2 Tax=Aegilops tauschii subsp. strangulata TaxID=200361 RepID=A0A453GZW8_AEGTS
MWHGLTALVPLVSWHARRGCRPAPARWALFHHGEVRSGMSGWLMSLVEAATGAPVAVEEFGPVPVCFEEAVVFRRNLAGMSTERLLEAFDFIRCKVWHRRSIRSRRRSYKPTRHHSLPHGRPVLQGRGRRRAGVPQGVHTRGRA